MQTAHGEVETPAFVPVATQAVVKTLTSAESLQTKSQLLIANAFHLHLKPGEKVVQAAGGLHRFMNWPRPLMTDSGGFQVFSLGFGRDHGVGKVLNFFPGAVELEVGATSQPAEVKISEAGVLFRSPFDGREIFLGPRESMDIQEKLGADIIFAFDECTSPLATFEYAQESLERTHHWAKACVKTQKSRQALFGIVQGSHFKTLRETAARFISALDFDGFGIGGDLGRTKKQMATIISWVIPHLIETRPRHLLGIGYLEDIEPIIKLGIDLFDCSVPTHYARRGIAFTSAGRLDLGEKQFRQDRTPLDRRCDCEVCQNYSRSYLAHLVRAKEITALRHLTFHNLFFFNSYVEGLRRKIKQGKL